jgi:hypothetical protein
VALALLFYHWGTRGVRRAFVALTAAQAGAALITSDPGGVRLLLDTLGARVPVLTP